MAKFQFIALDNSGKERKGMVEAPNKESAITQIKGYGLTPARISQVKVGAKGGEKTQGLRSSNSGTQKVATKPPMYFGSAINAKALSVFTRQLATLLRAGLPLIRTLEVLLAQEKNPTFKWVLSQQVDNIRSGNTFSEGLAKFPKEFSPLYLNMVKAGEASGTLDVALDRLANFLLKVRQIRTKVVSASLYPIIVFTVSIGIVLFLMAFIVPRFAAIFEKQMGGMKFHWLTEFVLGMSNIITGNALEVLASVIGLVVAVLIFRSTPVGKTTMSYLKLNTPLIGDTFTKLYVSRFCRTLGSMMDSGVPILDSLLYARDAIGNHFIMDHINKIHRRVKDGEPISKPLGTVGVFPPMVSSMVEVGEETGDLPNMLNQVADIYDDEVDASVSGLTSVIEPLLIVFLALFVLVIAIALFLPFIQLMQGMGRS